MKIQKFPCACGMPLSIYVLHLKKEFHLYLSKRAKNGRGRQGRSKDTKTPVFGIIETGGRVVVQVSDWVTKRYAQEIIKKHVEDKSTMVTDGFAMYAFLSQGTEFKHVIVDHKNGQYVNGGFHTNSIENFWSLLKRGIIGIFHQVSPWHLQRYCDEFASRYNSRKITDAERFELSIKNSDGRLKYSQLIAAAPRSNDDMPAIGTGE